jgi:hypothetical protein
MVIACITCCSNATGPIAITAKSTFSNTTMIMITTITTIIVQRSPNTIDCIGSNSLIGSIKCPRYKSAFGKVNSIITKQ